MPQNYRFLLDTNAYGLLCEHADTSTLLHEISRKRFIITGSKIVRKELRDIPKKIRLGGRRLRLRALEIYDTVVIWKRDYSPTPLIESLSKEYYFSYTGKHGWEELKNDFQLVATASIHHVPIIVTNDFSTMASEEAITAYRRANKKYELPTPRFISLEEFLSLLR